GQAWSFIACFGRIGGQFDDTFLFAGHTRAAFFPHWARGLLDLTKEYSAAGGASLWKAVPEVAPTSVTGRWRGPGGQGDRRRGAAPRRAPFRCWAGRRRPAMRDRRRRGLRVRRARQPRASS